MAVDIVYPPVYYSMLSWLATINIPINLLPWACVFPAFDNVLFGVPSAELSSALYRSVENPHCFRLLFADYVLITILPLGFVMLLMLLSKALHARHIKHNQSNEEQSVAMVVADLCSDLVRRYPSRKLLCKFDSVHL